MPFLPSFRRYAMVFTAYSVLSLSGFIAAGHATAAPIDSWSGEWTGECQVVPQHAGTSQFDVSLTVANITPTTWQWKIIYEFANGRREVRDYRIVTVSEQRGHYVIDERNGLLIDAFLSGESLMSAFTINGNLITSRYAKDGDAMAMDLPMFSLGGDHRTSCLTGNPQMCVRAFATRSIQTCKLTR